MLGDYSLVWKAELGRSHALSNRCLVGRPGPLTCLLAWRQLAYAGVMLLAYLAAYAPELALWLRPHHLALRKGAAEGEAGLQPGLKTAAAACANGDLRAEGAAQDDLATEKRNTRLRAGETAETASDSAASLQPEGQAASVGVLGEAGAANDRASALKPCGGEASDGASGGGERAQARSGGGAGGGGALLDWRTLRLCASFSLQARGPPFSTLLSTAWQPISGRVCRVFLSNATGVSQHPILASCHVCA